MEKCEDAGVIETIRCIVCPTGCEIDVKRTYGSDFDNKAGYLKLIKQLFGDFDVIGGFK
jgi:hypothetical protein